jgi:hypothetical protein
MIWIHKNPKKVSNDFEELALRIPHKDEDLSLNDIVMCETVML